MLDDDIYLNTTPIPPSTSSTPTTHRNALSEDLGFDILLSVPRLKSDFILFLRSHNSEAYMKFWKDVQRYKRLRDQSNKQIQSAIRIYQTYISDGGPLFINISEGAKASLGGSVHRPFRSYVTRDMFREAEMEAYQFMKLNMYPLFCTTTTAATNLHPPPPPHHGNNGNRNCQWFLACLRQKLRRYCIPRNM
eukprot:TRINITY_DN4776_c0_g2_i1.p1 TRINITY_DN4776_c0_g2~~TRINITY_DN4776_c0_g2_i1.p1  ORF type:complete len:192 (+),score=27.97 TRINITY_DN4776_c0_g2_i1:54-629(+)